MSYFKKSEIAIFSDIHIGLQRNSKFWHDVTWNWANWFIKDIKKKGIKDVVFCGDYFHTRDEVSVDTLHFGTKLLALFKDFNLTMIVGNHDCFLKDSSEVNSISPYSEWPNVKIVEKIFTTEAYGKTINFVPWGTEYSEIPNSDITFGHFEINYYKMNTYAICDNGIEDEDFVEKCPIIISGHFHLRDERKYSNGGKVVYVGNPFQMDFNDAETSKGYYTMDIITGEMKFTENNISPKHFNLLLSNLIAEKTITDKIKNTFLNNLIKLKVDRKTTHEDIEFILNVYKSLNPSVFNIEYESNFSEYDLEEQRKDFSGINIQQAIIEFIDLLDANNKNDLIEYTIELYNRIIK
jgi:DNA repair exonuclease SbcCD nuclease subunit